MSLTLSDLQWLLFLSINPSIFISYFSTFSFRFFLILYSSTMLELSTFSHQKMCQNLVLICLAILTTWSSSLLISFLASSKIYQFDASYLALVVVGRKALRSTLLLDELALSLVSAGIYFLDECCFFDDLEVMYMQSRSLMPFEFMQDSFCEVRAFGFDLSAYYYAKARKDYIFQAGNTSLTLI